MKMNKQGGFTLIELVVVIIILGILAVTAAPKFMDLQGDARTSTLEGLKGALQGANTLVYSKASIQGDERSPSATVQIDASGETINTVYGYLDATAADLQAALELDPTEWTIVESPTVETELSDALIIHHNGRTPSDNNKCWVEYAPAADGVLPKYYVEHTDC